MRPRVYLAGPLSSSGDRERNVQNAIEMTKVLIHNGFAVLTPHLTHYVDPDDSMGWETWLQVDEPWVEVADALYRMPGESRGADREESLANRLGIPVFKDLASALAWLRGGAYRAPTLVAHGLVHGNRGSAYGHPFDDFTRTGRMWAAILGLEEVTPEQVALCMAAVKIGRECNAHKADNLVDLAGYAETAAMVAHERRQRSE